MNSEVLLIIFVALNALTSTGTLIGVFHLWWKLRGEVQEEDEETEDEILERNLNTRLRDLQTTRFSLKFPNLPDDTTGKKRQ